ncbi:MAG: bifunctional riboflavin kinase/FAD synthetase [Pseudomonadota bacterium]
MELIRGLHNLRERHRGCVLSIGNFDGFHLGHQALVTRLKQHAARVKLPAVIQIFEPTPREFFVPSSAPGRINSLRGKLRALSQAGVDRVHCLRFGQQLSAWPAERYIEDMLVAKLGVKAVLVGDDFRFGAGRGGDISLLQRMGEKHGFVAEAMSTVEISGMRASSSAVRDALAASDLEKAAQLLGRPYRYLGRVRRGLQLGRKLNMPTANIVFKRRPALRMGIYAVRARIDNGAPQNGVANLGVRPTLGGTPCLLETHVFGASGDWYGKEMEVEFARFLRPEAKFDSLDALAAQMHKDSQDAQAHFDRLSANGN